MLKTLDIIIRIQKAKTPHKSILTFPFLLTLPFPFPEDKREEGKVEETAQTRLKTNLHQSHPQGTDKKAQR